MKYNVRIKEGNNEVYITKVGENYMLTLNNYDTITITEEQAKEMFYNLNKDIPCKKALSDEG